MTQPEPLPEQMVVPQWQDSLLRRIHHLAAEFVRIEALGAHGYDGTDGTSEQEWLDHLDTLSAVREATERLALSVGIPQRWIERARNDGAGRPEPDTAAAEEVHAAEAKQFYLDMLGVDLWNLQRMAFVAAARNERIAQGRYEFGADPVAGAEYRRNMAVLHTRVSALSAAADLTPIEAQNLWGGAEVENLTHATAVAVTRWDNLTLEFAWRRYATPTSDADRPPYIPFESRDAASNRHPASLPPQPEQLIEQATEALQARTSRPVTGPFTIDAAVETFLPAGTRRVWAYQPPDEATATTPPGHGADHDP